MATPPLRFIVRTPHETVVEMPATSIRVLTETGHVGIRHHMEPVVLPIEAGLVLARVGDRVTLVGAAGGLLSSDGHNVTLFTPVAVVGTDPAAVQRALNDTLTSPDSELAIRARLGRLEGRILAELRRGPRDGPARAGER